MRLADFIAENIEPILVEWESFARSLASGTVMTKLALRNAAGKILLAIAQDMQSDQNPDQRVSKSKGKGGADSKASDRLDHVSQFHGSERVSLGFDIMEVVAEYRALRASVLRLWRESQPRPNSDDIYDIMRFNEAIDQSLIEAVGSYTNRVEQSRRMFLAILSHDLRSPVGRINGAAQVAARGTTNEDSSEVDPV